MVPYGGGGPPPPDAGAGFSLVAPVRDFVSRQYNSLMEAFPSRPRNAMERRVREMQNIAVAAPIADDDPDLDGPLAVENGQAALPPPIRQNAAPLALEGGQAALPPPPVRQNVTPLALEGGQPALPAPAMGATRLQALSPPPIMNRGMAPLPAPPPTQTIGATRAALPSPPPVRQIRDHGPAAAGPARPTSRWPP